MSLELGALLIFLAFICPILSMYYLLKGIDKTVNKKNESSASTCKKYGVISGLFLFGAMFCFAALIAK